MTATACKLPPRAHPDNPPVPLAPRELAGRGRSSEAWLPAAVARRLILVYTAPIAGRFVEARLRRLQGSSHPEWATRWIYWLTVIDAIERRCGYRFSVPRTRA
jgi:hypothetical protein